MRRQESILFFNRMWGELPAGADAELPEPFVLTEDRSRLEEACAVVFHLPTLSRYGFFFRRRRKRKGQLWVAWSMESEAHYPFLGDQAFMSCFDLTMTYSRQADVVTPYLDGDVTGRLRMPVAARQGMSPACALISSQFNQSGRREYLGELMKYFDVHSYGKLFRNRVIAEDNGRETKFGILSKYKFSLAFENAMTLDYVTEKFYDPLLAGAVPVYLGAPNINAFAPGEHCFINVADWESPRALAQHLNKVAGDDELYHRYFDWKSRPFLPEFAWLLQQQQVPALVRLCHKIRERL